MLKRTYTDEEGREYHTLDFVDKKDRDRVQRVAQAWDGRIKLLFELGHDLCENGNDLCEYEDHLQSFAEGRVRTHVGMALIDWGQCLLFEAKDHPMDKQLEMLEDVVEDAKEALGDDEEFQKVMAQAQKETK